MAIQTTGLLFFLAIITSQQCLNLQLLLLLSFILLTWFLSTWLVPGGHAWCGHRNPSRIPGPAGYPVVGSLPLMGSLAHRNLARISSRFRSLKLMALSLGFTPVIIASHPDTAREILSSPAFVDRPVKRAARLLMFERAIGFSPHGEYWRSLRRAAAMCLFAPRRLAAQEACRQACISDVLREVEMCRAGAVQFRGALQKAARNSIAGSVFGELNSRDKEELGVMVREGYEILGGFDWGDYFPAGWWPDFWGIGKRSEVLAGKVRAFVGGLVEERRKEGFQGRDDFLSLMLGMAEEERIADSDMVALLWELIFRGTDTVAILMEWAMARLVLHPAIQARAQAELDRVVGLTRHVADADLPNLPYLLSILKETLRLHPPGPLLSWARLSIQDVHVSKSYIPKGTTAMVNMWAIAHDPNIWPDPLVFDPERFDREPISIMGSDLRLAPFGSGRRVCPGKSMGLATCHLWLARLLHHYQWLPHVTSNKREKGLIDLRERLKLSMEMKRPLVCKAMIRNRVPFG